MIPFLGVTLEKCSPYNGNREEISSPISPLSLSERGKLQIRG